MRNIIHTSTIAQPIGAAKKIAAVNAIAVCPNPLNLSMAGSRSSLARMRQPNVTTSAQAAKANAAITFCGANLTMPVAYSQPAGALKGD